MRTSQIASTGQGPALLDTEIRCCPAGPNAQTAMPDTKASNAIVPSTTPCTFVVTCVVRFLCLYFEIWPSRCSLWPGSTTERNFAASMPAKPINPFSCKPVLKRSSIVGLPPRSLLRRASAAGPGCVRGPRIRPLSHLCSPESELSLYRTKGCRRAAASQIVADSPCRWLLCQRQALLQGLSAINQTITEAA